MENVVAFNNELSGLYDSKPPISKAKMAAITKSAMRAIKFYKHVVQSVEKFILKCKPEYKVPGLYVIDSIVRQSRHQFGPEKDVFAPRFARNIKETFANLFRCAPEDKSRIIRVLNLWQKNNVFAPEVIQPIFDLADPNHPIYQIQPASAGGNISGIAMSDMSAAANGLNTSVVSMDMNMSGSGVGGVHSGPTIDDKMVAIPDLSTNNLKQLLNDPNVLRQLQTLQNFQKFKQQEDKQLKFNEMRMQEEAFEKHLQNVLKASAPSAVIGGAGNEAIDLNKEVEFVSEEQKIEVINLDGNDSRSPSPERERYKRRRSRSRSRERGGNVNSGGGGGGGGGGGPGGGGGSNRDRDRDRRRRSRSRSRSRSPRSSRRRPSRDRGNERSTREKEKEREREHERERRRKGLPDIKKEHLSVCSTTLWVGHLSKLVYQEELSDSFGEFGDIVSIDQIVPRGCAFIVMNRRQDAHKAMQALKNHKLQGRAITISWAAGKGVKSKEWKDFWDLELGVTYIPWSKLDNMTDIDSLEEGGMFDEDSMPAWMKDKIKHMKSIKEKGTETIAAPLVPPTTILFGIDTTQPPPGPPGPPAGPPPPSLMSMVAAPGQFSMAPSMAGPPPPRPMLGPMPSGIGPLSGIPIPPNLVAGMPPPHPMMMPPGMMPPGFPPIPPGQIEKGRGVGGAADGVPPIGPPSMGQFMPMGPHQIGLPPPGGPSQFPPPLNVAPAAAACVSNNDDQMDIEMDEDDGPSHAAAGMVFNQPPPLFHGGVGGNMAGPAAGIGEGDDRSADFNRDRRGSAVNTRWAGRGGGPEDEGLEGGPFSRWQENGNVGGGGGNFGGNGRSTNFGEGRGGGGGRAMNMPPLDMNPPLQRPDFLDEFDNRGLPRGPRGNGNPNGDFFAPNMQNRFNQPTSLLQMRIPPPNAFNPRMNGPPMFMRGQGGGGGPGGRPQGFFNDRGPFDRGGRGGGMGRGGRGGRGSGGPNNWRDEDDDDGSGAIFKRRMQGGPGAGGGNRFRDGGMDDRYGRGGSGGGGGGGRRGGPQRGGDRDRRDNDRGSRSGGGNRRQSRDDHFDSFSGPPAEEKPVQNAGSDTEDDWDQDLEDFDNKAGNKTKPHNPFSDTTSRDAEKAEKANNKAEENENSSNNNNNYNSEKEIIVANKPTASTEDSYDKGENESVPKIAPAPVAQDTPLYDELPPPVSAAALQGDDTHKHESSTQPPPAFEDVNTRLEEPSKASTASPAPNSEGADRASE